MAPENTVAAALNHMHPAPPPRPASALCGRSDSGSENPQSAANAATTIGELIRHRWAQVVRVVRHLGGSEGGLVPLRPFLYHLSVALSLRRTQDLSALGDICTDCCVPQTTEVRGQPQRMLDVSRLWTRLLDLRPRAWQGPGGGQAWRRRFRVRGVIDQALQRVCLGGAARQKVHGEGPPYAIDGDCDSMAAIVNEYYRRRCADMRRVLEQQQNGSTPPGVITAAQFRRALKIVEPHGEPNAAELDALLGVVDPRGRGTVNIDDFLDKFALEYLKSKSTRVSLGTNGHDGKSHILQWPQGDAGPRRRELVASLRRRPRPPLRAHQSKASRLRRKVGRDTRRGIGVLEEEQRLRFARAAAKQRVKQRGAAAAGGEGGGAGWASAAAGAPQPASATSQTAADGSPGRAGRRRIRTLGVPLPPTLSGRPPASPPGSPSRSRVAWAAAPRTPRAEALGNLAPGPPPTRLP
eukprot:TRINITY_DN18878_c0_g1_i1.p1 TRINITY_DN18878_c0_g1~~TRINITY_DN18878_c0_g1_i1.p1  ORF type:complete len:515 (+),score=119.20 TRINITY_DN18878_c0_g1_i1:150-1547(+)